MSRRGLISHPSQSWKSPMVSRPGTHSHARPSPKGRTILGGEKHSRVRNSSLGAWLEDRVLLGARQLLSERGSDEKSSRATTNTRHSFAPEPPGVFCAVCTQEDPPGLLLLWGWTCSGFSGGRTPFFLAGILWRQGFSSEREERARGVRLNGRRFRVDIWTNSWRCVHRCQFVIEWQLVIKISQSIGFCFREEKRSVRFEETRKEQIQVCVVYWRVDLWKILCNIWEKKSLERKVKFHLHCPRCRWCGVIWSQVEECEHKWRLSCAEEKSIASGSRRSRVCLLESDSTATNTVLLLLSLLLHSSRSAAAEATRVKQWN